MTPRQDDLFEDLPEDRDQGGEEPPAGRPLADRIRPSDLDGLLGQDHILGEGKLLRDAIQKDDLFSFIMWGPPGCGKTTLARIIARASTAHFVEFSAVTSGVAEVRRIIKEAQARRRLSGKRTILFVDEIHRFNKAQQDAFLPHVENGTITLIGATTENPNYEVIAPLASRTRIYQMRALDGDALKEILRRAIEDGVDGLGGYGVDAGDDVLEFLITWSNGDARYALNALETAATRAPLQEDGRRTVTMESAMDSIQKRPVLYDKSGESHYDMISAFIKSIRGSDPNAALYWMARMLEGGEDPHFIARRMVISAAEDIGAADPIALTVAVSAAHALEMIGMPEGRIPLASTATYLACAPKSDAAYKALNRALDDVANKPHFPVPLHLRNPAFRGASALGYGSGLRHPHHFDAHFVFQQYMPDNLITEVYYEPSCEGHEAKIRERLRKWWPHLYGNGGR
jgi:putative ATPase